MVFTDLASAIDAGLPLESIGGDPRAGERVLADLCVNRGVQLLACAGITADALQR